MNSKTNSSSTDAALLSTLDGRGGSAQERIADLLEVKLQKELKAEQETAAEAEAFRQARIENARREESDRNARQNGCPHMKPNFRPAIGGQKDHKGNAHFFCQYCSKEWGNDLPMHLRIPAEMVGGPQ